MKDIHKTAWARRFKKECPCGYETAIKYVSDPELKVTVFLSDETGEIVWAIAVYNSVSWGDTGYWLDARKTKKAALDLCKKMGWKVVSQSSGYAL